MAKVSNSHCVTNPVRLLYPHVWEPYASQNGNGVPYYSVCLLIPKDDTETVEAIQGAIDYAIDNATVFNGKKPNKGSMRIPLRDGDTERDDDLYKGCWFINAKSKFAPHVVDQNNVEITDHNAIYPGVYANVILGFYCFSNNGNKGVGCGLGNIQKVRDGERIGGSGDVLNFGVISDATTARAGSDLPF